MFVSPCAAAVAANTEGSRFGHFAAESEQTSRKLQRLVHLRAKNRPRLQPQALARDLNYWASKLLASLWLARLCRFLFRLAPWRPVSGCSGRAFLRRRLHADSDRSPPQALEQKSPRTATGRGFFAT